MKEKIYNSILNQGMDSIGELQTFLN